MPDLSVFKSGSKPAWIIAGIAGVGVAGWMLWKHYHPATTTTATAAGYGYGYGAPAGYGYGVSPIYGYGFGGTGSTSPYYGYGGYGYQGTPAPTTNAEWFQAAVNYLGNSATVEAALAKYLAGQAVTSQQELICQEAEAAVGPPPQNGPNGYPPNIKTSGSGGGGNAQNPVTGLHATNVGTTGADISWNPSSGATSYKITATHGNVTMTGATSARIHDIGPQHWTSTVSVLAEPAAPNARAASTLVTRR